MLLLSLSISISIVNRRTQGTHTDSRRATDENACTYIQPRRRRISGRRSLVLVVWLDVRIAAVVTATCQIRFVPNVILVEFAGRGSQRLGQQRQLFHLLKMSQRGVVPSQKDILVFRSLIPLGLSSNSGSSKLEEIYNPTCGGYAHAHAR